MTQPVAHGPVVHERDTGDLIPGKRRWYPPPFPAHDQHDLAFVIELSGFRRLDEGLAVPDE